MEDTRAGGARPNGMRFDVFAMGHALVDLEFEVEEEFLRSQGLAVGGWKSLTAPERAQLKTASKDRPFQRSAGGSAANTVVGVVSLGGRGCFCGKVGLDELGTFFLDDLKRQGANACVGRADGPTGTSVIFVTEDGERSMATHHGAASSWAPEDVPANLIGRSRFLLIEGYLLADETAKRAVEKAVSIARGSGVQVALTVAACGIAESCGDLIWELVHGPADLLLLNEEEARALTGLEDPVAGARMIHSSSVDVALTLGSQGSVLMSGEQLWGIDAVPVEAIDTTGAGDAFASGLIYGLSSGWSWPEAGKMGSEAAARVIGAVGARLTRRHSTNPFIF